MTYIRLILFLWLLPTTLFAAPSFEDLFSPTDYEAARLSPDGKHFALTAQENGMTRLIIYNTESMEALAAFGTPRYRNIGDFYWVNNERVVFDQTISTGWLDYPLSTGELFALNIDNSRKFPLAGFAAGDYDGAYYMMNTLRGDRTHIKVLRVPITSSPSASRRPAAFTMDVYKRPRSSTGAAMDRNTSDRILSPLPGGWMMTNNAGEVALAWHLNEDVEFSLSYRNGDGDWVPLDEFSSAGGSLQSFGNPVIDFTPDDNGMYFLANGQYGTAGIYEFDLESKKSKLLYEHPQFDVEWDDLIYSSDNEIVGVSLLGHFPESHFFSEHRDAKLIESLTASFPYQRITVFNHSEDGNLALVDVRGDQNPGALYLFDKTKPSLRLLFQVRSKINPNTIAKREPFAIKNAEGMVLNGFLTSMNPQAAKQPTIIIPHGGPHGSRDTFLYDSEAQLFAQNGYHVVQINFRGSGGYGSEFLEAGAREWAKGMIDDINLAAKWAVQSGLAAPDKLCIYGGSYGAFAAMSAVIQAPDLYQCTAGYAGVYDLTRMYDSDIVFIRWGKAYLEHVIGTDPEQLKAESPVYLADKIKVPVLLAHGGEDQRAPIIHAELMKEALEEAGNKPEWIYEAKEGHGFYDTDHRVNYYKKLLAFMDKHLKK